MRKDSSIAILSIFSKALERAAYNQLIGYLSNHNLISNNQHGFRKQVSTTTAEVIAYITIWICIDTWLESFNSTSLIYKSNQKL